MPKQHIPLIMEIMDRIVSPDERKRKFTDRQILKILILLQIFRISYRSSAIFLRNHEEYMEMIGIREIPSFQTLSRRAVYWICAQSTGKLAFFIQWNPLPPLTHSCSTHAGIQQRQGERYGEITRIQRADGQRQKSMVDVPPPLQAFSNLFFDLQVL